MNSPLRLMLVAGARPNFMKIAPLVHAIGDYNNTRKGLRELSYRLVHTGQHYDAQMSNVFFEQMRIPDPDFNLEVGSGSHAAQTAKIMLAFEPICSREKPDWVIVVGDVNSTMACTLVASKLGTRVAHIEAGLRSFDRTMPEEINRLVTDALADLLLTPSRDADENLKREGVAAAKIRCVGNILIDALIANLELSRQSTVLERLGLKRKSFAFVTLHRPSNVDDAKSLQRIIQALCELSKVLPIAFAVHPRTQKMLAQAGFSINPSGKLHLLDPVGYHDSLCLTENARLVLTDSGGLQEEATYFRTPCLTLRPNTERPITITVGTNRLTNVDTLARDVQDVLSSNNTPGRVPEMWDGRTAQRVVQCLLE